MILEVEKPMWTIDEAMIITKRIKEPIYKKGWAFALTGGLVYRGYSDKDLDILFYPFNGYQSSDGYVAIIWEMQRITQSKDFFIIDHKTLKKNKLVCVMNLPDEKRIDLLFPTVLLGQRKDKIKTVYRAYEEEPFRSAVLDITSKEAGFDVRKMPNDCVIDVF